MALKDVQSITDLNEGSVDELFRREWTKVLENIQDPTTEATARRKIVIEIAVIPTTNRSMCKTIIQAKTTFAGIKADEGAVMLELTAGGVVALAPEAEVQPELDNLIEMKGVK